ncbi:uncharacterized protein LOC134932743 isoform X2 [Pseudophryne corroboree]|uniref:uncharacterized protein LOC134932743 isoform X2 n=1 Tax=Pseudophryne corroboree TaxID=495146 RepID=UPI00308189B7
MVLSGSQCLILAVSLALCACFLLPRMFGGGAVRYTSKRDPRRMPPPIHGRSPRRESHSKTPIHGGGSEKRYPTHDQVKGAIEEELKNENVGSGRSMAFTLMPIYAVGVAVFAAYKFTKMKSKENSKSKSSNEDDKKAVATENQLLALERHLSQTEHMLNSLLTQLDPLSNCVNTLATEQKDEIMSQLQSIRQLMKNSGMDKTTHRNSAKQTCEDTLEGLIHSFKTRNSNICEGDDENESEESTTKTEKNLSGHNLVAGESAIQTEGSPCDEEASKSDLFDGLRKRNVKD